MKYIEEIFDNIKLEKFGRDGDSIYDPIRSFLLAATPEECVRQKQLHTCKGTWGYLLIGFLWKNQWRILKKAHVEERILLSIVMMSAQMY